jgi:hypothetical protein
MSSRRVECGTQEKASLSSTRVEAGIQETANMSSRIIDGGTHKNESLSWLRTLNLLDGRYAVPCVPPSKILSEILADFSEPTSNHPVGSEAVSCVPILTLLYDRESVT